jgi:bifunctional non-homologous end joining protein LigD
MPHPSGHPLLHPARLGLEQTARQLVAALQPLSQHAVLLDGEVIVQTPEGRSDFHALEKELKRQGGSNRLVYYVFDIL